MAVKVLTVAVITLVGWLLNFISDRVKSKYGDGRRWVVASIAAALATAVVAVIAAEGLAAFDEADKAPAFAVTGKRTRRDRLVVTVSKTGKSPVESARVRVQVPGRIDSMSYLGKEVLPVDGRLRAVGSVEQEFIIHDAIVDLTALPSGDVNVPIEIEFSTGAFRAHDRQNTTIQFTWLYAGERKTEFVRFITFSGEAVADPETPRGVLEAYVSERVLSDDEVAEIINSNPQNGPVRLTETRTYPWGRNTRVGD